VTSAGFGYDDPEAKLGRIKEKIYRLCGLMFFVCLCAVLALGFYLAGPMYVLESGSHSYLPAPVMLAVVFLAGAATLIGVRTLLELIADMQDLRELERLALTGRFSSWAAHQIRNPLATIRGWAQLMGRPPATQEAVWACRRIMDAVDRVNVIIAQFMSLSHDLPLDYQPLSLAEVVQEAVTHLQDSTPHDTTVTITGQFGQVCCHRAVLAEAFKNILINAIEAIGTGPGTITINGQVAAERCRVVITDTGCGIPPGALGDACRIGYTTKPRGLGLGLPIAAAIVRAHGGTLSLQSRHGDPVAAGTAVSIDLPQAAAGELGQAGSAADGMPV